MTASAGEGEDAERGGEQQGGAVSAAPRARVWARRPDVREVDPFLSDRSLAGVDTAVRQDVLGDH